MGGESRRLARHWAVSAEARSAGVEVRSIAQGTWYAELARYRFLISPMGLGIQSTKIIEALLVLTIPIVLRTGTPTFDDLARSGVPLVVLDDWGGVSAQSLAGWWLSL